MNVHLAAYNFFVFLMDVPHELAVFTSIITSEKLESEKLNVAEVTQSEIAQKQKLQTVLEKINETLKLPPRSIKWNVDCKLLVLYAVPVSW